MNNFKVELKDEKTRAYNQETFDILINRLKRADELGILSHEELLVIRSALDHAVLNQLKQAVKTHMDYNGKLTVNSSQPNNWIECEFSDSTVTFDVSISRDRELKYGQLSYDDHNIKRIENNSEYRFSMKELKATQDRFNYICDEVFKQINGDNENANK